MRWEPTCFRVRVWQRYEALEAQDNMGHAGHTESTSPQYNENHHNAARVGLRRTEGRDVLGVSGTRKVEKSAIHQSLMESRNKGVLPYMGCNESKLRPAAKFRHNSSKGKGCFPRRPARTSAAIAVVGSCKQPVQGFSEGNTDDKNSFGLNIMCAEQECRLIGLEDGSEGEEEEKEGGDEDLKPGRNEAFNEEFFSEEKHPKQNQFESFEEDTEHVLIPGLPNDLAQLCLMHLSFIKYDTSLRCVSKSWRKILSSEEFYATRSALKISETFISFVVHGNRVQIFNLKEQTWFCLPPLPLDRTISTPERNIDPYEWWWIETVAALQGTLFVMGGDQTTSYNYIRPTEPASTVHKYDYCRGQWIKVAPMQIPRSNSAAVASKKNILVAGGNEKMEEGASAEVYDPITNCWSFVSRMHSAMKGCVGVEHRGLIYVKGTNLGIGSPIEGELYDPVKDLWIRMNPGLRRGLARGPIASANSQLFVADWKDSLLKMYVIENDSWEVIAGLPAKISRLVGHRDKLYGLTGKIKVDPYNHLVISDSPDGVWQLDLDKKTGFDRKDWLESAMRRNCISEFEWRKEDNREVGKLELRMNSNSLKARIELMSSRRGTSTNIRWNMLHTFRGEDDSMSELSGMPSSSSNSGFDCGMQHEENNQEYIWKCIWKEPKQILKT
ncbi:hypothetical protein KI387_011531, partial [Taxus chinensis]